MKKFLRLSVSDLGLGTSAGCRPPPTEKPTSKNTFDLAQASQITMTLQATTANREENQITHLPKNAPTYPQQVEK